MAFGDSAEQGLVRGQNFYHADLGIAITAPTGWRIQNDPQQLALVNAAGDAALVMQVAPPKAGATHEEVIRNLLKPSQGKVERTSINGLQATLFSGKRASNQGEQTLEATLVTGPKSAVYVFTSAGKTAAALEQAKEGFTQAQNSFRSITAQDVAAAKAWTLKIAPFPAGGFAALAKNSPLPQAEAQLRLINGFYSGGVPTAGQMVKVIE
jgi:predicted Zn-dependent protease